MANTPAKAIAKSKTITKGYVGLCLMFVRVCFGIGAKWPSAASAWANAKKRHLTTSTKNIPVGAPVFFDIPTNKYGHVAVYLGAGKFRTNWSARGTVITATLDHAAFRTMKMLGWSEDLNGVTIPGLKPIASGGSSSGDLKLGSSGSRVLKLQKEMNRVFPSYANFAGDGKYGPYNVSVMKEFQRRTGLVEDGITGNITIRELAKHGVKL